MMSTEGTTCAEGIAGATTAEGYDSTTSNGVSIWRAAVRRGVVGVPASPQRIAAPDAAEREPVASGGSERVLADTARRGAAVVAAAERAGALRGAAVREGLGLHVAGRLALDRVVTDLRRGVEGLVDVAHLDQPALVGRLRPCARQAIGLELDGNRAGVALA